jgi:hypothetical protein
MKIQPRILRPPLHPNDEDLSLGTPVRRTQDDSAVGWAKVILRAVMNRTGSTRNHEKGQAGFPHVLKARLVCSHCGTTEIRALTQSNSPRSFFQQAINSRLFKASGLELVVASELQGRCAWNGVPPRKHEMAQVLTSVRDWHECGVLTQGCVRLSTPTTKTCRWGPRAADSNLG